MSLSFFLLRIMNRPHCVFHLPPRSITRPSQNNLHILEKISAKEATALLRRTITKVPVRNGCEILRFGFQRKAVSYEHSPYCLISKPSMRKHEAGCGSKRVFSWTVEIPLKSRGRPTPLLTDLRVGVFLVSHTNVSRPSKCHSGTVRMRGRREAVGRKSEKRGWGIGKGRSLRRVGTEGVKMRCWGRGRSGSRTEVFCCSETQNAQAFM